MAIPPLTCKVWLTDTLPAVVSAEFEITTSPAALTLTGSLLALIIPSVTVPVSDAKLVLFAKLFAEL